MLRLSHGYTVFTDSESGDKPESKMSLFLETLETRKSESGSVFQLKRKVSAGDNTKYLVIRVGSKLGESSMVFEGESFAQAADCLDWWLSGCPC